MEEYFNNFILGFICYLIILHLYNNRRISKFRITGSVMLPEINKDVYIRYYKTSCGIRCATVTDNALLLTLKKPIMRKLWEAVLKFENGGVEGVLTIVTPDKNIRVFRDGEICERTTLIQI